MLSERQEPRGKRSREHRGKKGGNVGPVANKEDESRIGTGDQEHFENRRIEN